MVDTNTDALKRSLTRLGGTKTKSTPDRMQTMESFAKLMKSAPDSDPVTVGLQLGLTEGEIQALFPKKTDDLADIGLPSLPTVKESAAMQKLRVEQQAAAEKTIGRGARNIERIDALNRIESEKGLKQIGPGIVPAMLRFADRQLEGLGIDIAAGRQSDMQTVLSESVFDIGEITELWKGAISDYENKIFAQTAGTSDKDPVFIRNKAVKQVYASAGTTIRATMVDELNSAFDTELPVSNVYTSGNNIKRAMDFIAQNANLPDLNSVEPGSKEQEAYARQWLTFAKSPDSRMLIRASILNANANKGLAKMGDPKVIRGLIQQGLVEDGTLDVYKDGSQPAQPATQEVLDNLGSDESQGLSFNTEDEARAYLRSLKPEDRPTSIKIGGKTVNIKKGQ